jgi:hypothetical protein
MLVGITLPLSGRQGLYAGARYFEEACPLEGQRLAHLKAAC